MDCLDVKKVLIPSVALEVLLHYKVWEKTSLRKLTLGLALVNTYWLATTLNLSLLVSPLLLKEAAKSEADAEEKLKCGAEHFNILNKLEIPIAVLGLDLYCEWRKRIIDNNGFVDNCLAAAIWAPVLVTAVQAAVILPKVNKQKTFTAEDGPKPVCAYVGFEAVKFAGLAVAGLRFGKMLII
ncbi:hypothetical protein K501DRAFT_266865 [Backusella circina FSU 941]|nr:hypothetical protein K501DRAFT_266865 [Backusella circina FSU 941]